MGISDQTLVEGECPKQCLEVKPAGAGEGLGALSSLAQTCCSVQRGGGSGLQVTAGDPAGFSEAEVLWD